ncbi:MAG: HDOD domain-containing protein [bacterium]|nr:HDOD domain-containing protein [bacterium]
MNKNDIIEELQRAEQILSLPQVLARILEEVGKEDFSADTLSKIILQDPSLTGKILKLANSSAYKRMSEITTVHQAVAMLGVTTVKCLALSSSIFHPETIAAETGIDPKEFFIYILSIAAASDKIARAVGIEAPEEAMVAGLLNDIGSVFFLHHHPREYRKVLSHTRKGVSVIEAERKVFGVDHAEVGARIATIWKLPEFVRKSIASNHDLNQISETDKLSNCVRLATLISDENFSGYQQPVAERMARITEVSEALSLSKADVDSICSSLLAGSVEMAEYLGVDVGDYETMLVKANQEIWRSYLTIENLFKERQELSQKLLQEEREKGAIQSKNVAMATLSHYLNNAAMAVYGKSQIMRLLQKNDKRDKLLEQLPDTLDVIDRAVMKIVAVLEEMREVSPIDDESFCSVSRALNLDDKLAQRMGDMNEDQKWNLEVVEQTLL